MLASDYFMKRFAGRGATWWYKWWRATIFLFRNFWCRLSFLGFSKIVVSIAPSLLAARKPALNILPHKANKWPVYFGPVQVYMSGKHSTNAVRRRTPRSSCMDKYAWLGFPFLHHVSMNFGLPKNMRGPKRHLKVLKDLLEPLEVGAWQSALQQAKSSCISCRFNRL